MDLLIEKSDLTLQLSMLGVTVTDVKASNTTVENKRESVNYRNGKIFYGANHTEKKITVKGFYYAENEYEDQVKQDELNGLFGGIEPFFISRMYSTFSLYHYERPGQSKGFNFQKSEEQLPYRYHWKVIIDGDIDYSFQGYSDKGLLYSITINFVTSDTPYGITWPEDIELRNNEYIAYSGTAPCSQLEYPFEIVLISSIDQAKTFSLSLGNQQFTYQGTTIIKKDDVFRLKGSSFLLNELNINDKTNIQYFTLMPNNENRMLVSTDFKGKITMKNKVEFYL